MQTLKVIAMLMQVLGIPLFCFGQLALLKIEQNQKYGYIDTSRMTVIPCRFHTLGDFSEGLATARINDLYGYIDEKGNFVIEPQFEYATRFSQGLAQVYNQGTSFFIDRQGKQVPFLKGQEMGDFKFGVANVVSDSGGVGLSNQKGQFVLPAIYNHIGGFEQGLAVISRKNKKVKYFDGYEYGVIDTTGKFIVPFGMYAKIEGFSHGVAVASGKRDKWTGLIDQTGRLLFKINRASIFIDELTQLERIEVTMRSKKTKDTESHLYKAYANKKGDLVINDPENRWGYSFSAHRAFVGEEGAWRLVDTLGKQINSELFDEVLDGVFYNGLAWVKRIGEANWSIVDLSGKVIQKTSVQEVLRIPNSELLMYNLPIEDEEQDIRQDQFGLITFDGIIVTPAFYQDYDRTGFQHGYLFVIENGYLKYINKNGKGIWGAKFEPNFCSLNIDYMLRGHFYAASAAHPNDLGGFAKADNAPQAITTEMNFPTSLEVTVKENQDSVDLCSYTLYISNQSGVSQLFNAQDSRLYLKLQAKDTKGEWRDIEYLPSSWCGNSYHLLTLPNQTYWSFPVPRFEGSLPTVLRAELKVVDPTDDNDSTRKKKDYIIYSNEYKGGINPAQFWRKPGYSPAGLMDPYQN